MKTSNEIKAALQVALEKYMDVFNFVGVRFEDKARTVAETIEDESADNRDREDEREFPEFGTGEYEGYGTMGGISAWDLANFDDFADQIRYGVKHAYVIASDSHVWMDAEMLLDEGEIVLEGAAVMEIIF